MKDSTSVLAMTAVVFLLLAVLLWRWERYEHCMAERPRPWWYCIGQ